MPTYQYACTACDHRFETVQAFSDSSLTTCPECQGRLRKLFGSVGVVFKGSGFYRTDSRANGSGASEEGSGPDSGKSESSNGSKSESGTKSDSGSGGSSDSSGSSGSGGSGGSGSDGGSAKSSTSSSGATKKAS